jgi:alkylated DNA repair dioxygenase AlkB
MDLFGDPSDPWRIPLSGGDVSYCRDFLCGLDFDLDVELKELINEVPWRQESVVVWGKRHNQPRLVAWYGDTGKSYTYSGILLEPLAWTERLRRFRVVAEQATEVTFNSVLLNYYRDNNDSMGYHSDDERELGPRPTIASISIGSQRTILFKSKLEKTLKPIRVELESGSLLIMRGDTQKNWKHAIDKQRRPCGPRINLTFRQIY